MASKISVVRSAICFDEEEDTQYVQPILIYFSGALPKHLLHDTVPIEVSVTVAPEYCSFISPIVGAVPEDAFSCKSESKLSVCMSDRHAVTNLDNSPISFLPLPSAFGTLDHKPWASLCSRIQRWLISTPDSSQRWTWGRDIFWLAFVAAHPDFPAGKWPIWDPCIPVEGTFIEGWMSGSLMETIVGNAATEKTVHERIRLWIWDEFRRVVPLFYPYPLTAMS